MLTIPVSRPSPILLRGRSVTRHALAILCLVAGAVGCDSLTDVDAPDVVTLPDLGTPAGALTLFHGASSLFQLSYSGTEPGRNGTGQVFFTGLFGDELTGTTYQIYFVNPASRTISDPDLFSPLYNALQKARVNALNARDALERHRSTEVNRIARMLAFTGYTELFFGENFCSGVPLANVAEGVATSGRPRTSAELFQAAIAHFDSALARADSADVQRLATVGKARALLNLGQFGPAGAEVATVPDGFVYSMNHSAAILPNGYGVHPAWITVPEVEGVNGLNYRSAGDPRVPLVQGGIGIDGVTEVFTLATQSSQDSPVPLASSVEARLIEAEAALNAGDVAGWLAKLNALRASTPDLAPLADPGTEAARVDLTFRERAFWLFLTGHRHGDLRRLVRQYGREAGAVFPAGPYRDGHDYGSDVTFTPPVSEQANPLYHSCLDRSA